MTTENPTPTPGTYIHKDKVTIIEHISSVPCVSYPCRGYCLYSDGKVDDRPIVLSISDMKVYTKLSGNCLWGLPLDIAQKAQELMGEECVCKCGKNFTPIGLELGGSDWCLVWEFTWGSPGWNGWRIEDCELAPPKLTPAAAWLEEYGGKKMRRSGWEDGHWVVCIKEVGPLRLLVDNSNWYQNESVDSTYCPTYGNWEEYKEPEKRMNLACELPLIRAIRNKDTFACGLVFSQKQIGSNIEVAIPFSSERTKVKPYTINPHVDEYTQDGKTWESFWTTEPMPWEKDQ